MTASPVQTSHTRPRTIAYIVGSARSGSTLLGMLLGNHPECFAMGEMDSLGSYLSRAKSPNALCTCGRMLDECPFWKAVLVRAQELLKETGIAQDLAMLRERPLNRQYGTGLFDTNIHGFHPSWIHTAMHRAALLAATSLPHCASRLTLRRFGGRYRKAAENSLFWYGIISQVSERPVVLDCGKGVLRMLALGACAPGPLKVIHLIRDGRGQAASMKRATRQDVATSARRWVRGNRRIMRMYGRMDASNVCRVSYEALCRDPRATLEVLYAFLGCRAFHEGEWQRALTLEKTSSHMLGGNPMRFRNDERTIAPDERWRDELSEDELRRFQNVKGAREMLELCR
ncbi:MAG: sulfotransferase [Planctomycetaceae bacterium]|nr:sulfotransferase [Planctomycetaceae bacterium]